MTIHLKTIFHVNDILAFCDNFALKYFSARLFLFVNFIPERNNYFNLSMCFLKLYDIKKKNRKYNILVINSSTRPLYATFVKPAPYALVPTEHYVLGVFTS